MLQSLGQAIVIQLIFVAHLFWDGWNLYTYTDGDSLPVNGHLLVAVVLVHVQFVESLQVHWRRSLDPNNRGLTRSHLIPRFLSLDPRAPHLEAAASSGRPPTLHPPARPFPSFLSLLRLSLLILSPIMPGSNSRGPQARFIVCKSVANGGVCNIPGCMFSHDIHLCEICRVYCSSVYHFRMHLQGKKHRDVVRRQRESDAATAAQRDRDDDDNDDSPVRNPYASLPTVDLLECTTCRTRVPSENWSSHLTSFNHKKKERFGHIQAAFDEAEKDKHGVSVLPAAEGGVDFGFLELDRIHTQSTKTVDLTVQFSTPGIMYLSEARLSSSLTIGRPRPSK